MYGVCFGQYAFENHSLGKGSPWEGSLSRASETPDVKASEIQKIESHD